MQKVLNHGASGHNPHPVIGKVVEELLTIRMRTQALLAGVFAR